MYLQHCRVGSKLTCEEEGGDDDCGNWRSRLNVATQLLVVVLYTVGGV